MRRTESAPDSWIVCEAATRGIVQGQIDCPRGGQVRVSDCLSCHLLETFEGERDPSLWCATPVVEATRPPWATGPSGF